MELLGEFNLKNCLCNKAFNFLLSKSQNATLKVLKGVSMSTFKEYLMKRIIGGVIVIGIIGGAAYYFMQG